MLKSRSLGLGKLCLVSTGLFYFGARALFGSQQSFSSSSASPVAQQKAHPTRLRTTNRRMGKREAIQIVVGLKLPILEKAIKAGELSEDEARTQYRQLIDATKNTHFKLYEELFVSFLDHGVPKARDFEDVIRFCVLQRRHVDAGKMLRLMQKREIRPTPKTWDHLCTSWLSLGEAGLEDAQNRIRAAVSTLTPVNWEPVSRMLYTRKLYRSLASFKKQIFAAAAKEQDSVLFSRLVQAVAKNKETEGTSRKETTLSRLLVSGRQEGLKLGTAAWRTIEAELGADFAEGLRNPESVMRIDVEDDYNLNFGTQNTTPISDTEAADVIFSVRSTLLAEKIKARYVEDRDEREMNSTNQQRYRTLLKLSFRANSATFPSTFLDFCKLGEPEREDLGLGLLWAYTQPSEVIGDPFLSDLQHDHFQLLSRAFPDHLAETGTPPKLDRDLARKMLSPDLLSVVAERRDVLMQRIQAELRLPGNQARATFDLLCTALAHPNHAEALGWTLAWAINPKQHNRSKGETQRHLAPGYAFYNRCAETFQGSPELLRALGPGFNVREYDNAVRWRARRTMLGPQSPKPGGRTPRPKPPPPPLGPALPSEVTLAETPPPTPPDPLPPPAPVVAEGASEPVGPGKKPRQKPPNARRYREFNHYRAQL